METLQKGLSLKECIAPSNFSTSFLTSRFGQTLKIKLTYVTSQDLMCIFIFIFFFYFLQVIM